MAHSDDNDFTFTWKIENFSCLPHQEEERLESAEFIIESVQKSKWRLWLYPKGVNNENGKGKDHISLFLEYMGTTPLTILHYISLETTDGEFEIQKLKKSEKKYFTNHHAIGNFQVISLKNLYQKKNLYLPQDVLTVKCCIFPDDKNSDQIPSNTTLPLVPNLFHRQCFSITRNKVQRASLTWPINNIGNLCENRRATHTYDFNSALTNSPSLKLSFSISNDLDEEHAQIEIIPTNSPYEGKRLLVKCKLTILTVDEDHQNSIEDTHLFNLQLDDKWILPSFIKIKSLTDEKYFFVDDTLILHCDFAFSCPGTEYHVQMPQYAPWHLEVPKPSKKNQLCGSICNLYTSGNLCDVTLHADGKAFPAHKLVLCARSPVFRAMFENDTKEKATNVVDIVDVDAETLERFLKFVHSDIIDVELTCVEVCNLYKAADKYQVDLLKQQCSIFILSTLSVSNVCDAIALADAREDHFLKFVVSNFLQYHSSEVFNSKEWETFMNLHPKLSGIYMFKAWQSKSFL